MVIEWEDAMLDPEFEGHPDDAPSEPIVCHDVGWLIKKTKKVVVLAQSVFPEGEITRVITVIPRKLITKETILVSKEHINGKNES